MSTCIILAILTAVVGISATAIPLSAREHRNKTECMDRALEQGVSRRKARSICDRDPKPSPSQDQFDWD